MEKVRVKRVHVFRTSKSDTRRRIMESNVMSLWDCEGEGQIISVGEDRSRAGKFFLFTVDVKKKLSHDYAGESVPIDRVLLLAMLEETE